VGPSIVVVDKGLARPMITTTAKKDIYTFLFGHKELMAGLGVAGFIVRFALQDTLGNFASGMMILLYRPYDLGDLVDVAGVFGEVDKMSLVSTTILTIDNQTVVVPNSKIWGDVIKNVTAQDLRRVDMVFGISYSDDIPKAESLLNDILKSHDRILDEPEPIVRVHRLGESSVDFVVRPWVKVDDYWEVYWDVTRTVKLRFDEEGVSIPFPQRDVHVHNENLIAD
jgi:small conductance mechanosensitive channel